MQCSDSTEKYFASGEEFQWNCGVDTTWRHV